jgi:hypothetical protein
MPCHGAGRGRAGRLRLNSALAVAQRDPTPGLPGHRSDLGRPVRVCPKEPVQQYRHGLPALGVSASAREPWLTAEKPVARRFIRKILILPAADDPPVRCRAQIKIRVGCLPNHAFLRPQPAALRRRRNRTILA